MTNSFSANFEKLLQGELPLFRGIYDFVALPSIALDDQEVAISWQILLTCQKYHVEATHPLYKPNELVFCTGARSAPGIFRLFPVHTHLMQHLRVLGIDYRAHASYKPGSQCVAKFINALVRHAKNLQG